MNTDPTTNVVVFELGGQDEPNGVAEAPTRQPDCIRQAWETVRRDHGVRADEVLSMFTEWAPSEQDARFIAETFPTIAKVQYHFPQPGPGGWAEAFEVARQRMAEAVAARHPDPASELLPLVWSGAAPQADLLDAVPHWTLVPGRLHVGLAVVASTPQGTIQLSHVTHHQVRECGRHFTDLMDEGYDALRDGLRIEGEETADGDLITVHRHGSVAAAALALPDFHASLADILHTDRLIVGLHCQQNLLVADANRRIAGHVERVVMAARDEPGELVPSVWLLDRSGLDLVAERR